MSDSTGAVTSVRYLPKHDVPVIGANRGTFCAESLSLEVVLQWKDAASGLGSAGLKSEGSTRQGKENVPYAGVVR
jgi:hypothetical protein